MTVVQAQLEEVSAGPVDVDVDVDASVDVDDDVAVDIDGDGDGDVADDDATDAAPAEKPPSSQTATPKSPAVDLTGKQRRTLRGLGHHLTPVLQVGHAGVSEEVVLQARAQLETHELIKIKVSENAPEGRHGAPEELAERTGAHLAQVLGRTALLYRKRKKNPKIDLG